MAATNHCEEESYSVIASANLQKDSKEDNKAEREKGDRLESLSRPEKRQKGELPSPYGMAISEATNSRFNVYWKYSRSIVPAQFANFSKVFAHSFLVEEPCWAKQKLSHWRAWEAL